MIVSYVSAAPAVAPLSVITPPVNSTVPSASDPALGLVANQDAVAAFASPVLAVVDYAGMPKVISPAVAINATTIWTPQTGFISQHDGSVAQPALTTASSVGLQAAAGVVRTQDRSDCARARWAAAAVAAVASVFLALCDAGNPGACYAAYFGVGATAIAVVEANAACGDSNGANK
jgi:hypothetical protein